LVIGRRSCRSMQFCDQTMQLTLFVITMAFAQCVIDDRFRSLGAHCLRGSLFKQFTNEKEMIVSRRRIQIQTAITVQLCYYQAEVMGNSNSHSTQIFPQMANIHSVHGNECLNNLRALAAVGWTVLGCVRGAIRRRIESRRTQWPSGFERVRETAPNSVSVTTTT
jgi:hypothetical protein